MIPAGERIFRDPHTASRVIAGEAVVLTPRNGRILTLNETGSCIWELLGSGPTMEDITAALVKEFEVTPADAQCDAQAFFDELWARDMVTLEQPRTNGDA